jgi:putative NADPH-quinone reductase
MPRRLLVINGHPDPRAERLCAALAGAYCNGAATAGRIVRRIDVGALDFPLILTAEAFETGPVPPDIKIAQEAVRQADHVTIVHPLWLGDQPALLKGFMEQVFRYGFALEKPGAGGWTGLLKGRSARIIVTMGMPGPVYRLMFGAYGVRSMERSVLWMSGFKPVRHTFFGGAGSASERRRGAWLDHVRALGARGE